MVERLLDELCRIHHLPLVVPDQELLHWLRLYNWPGNFRQLRTCLETMVIMARGRQLTLADLRTGRKLRGRGSPGPPAAVNR